MRRLLIVLVFIIIASQCSGIKNNPVPGANQIKLYRHLIDGRTVAVVANQTSMVGKTHLVEYLISKNININLL